METVHIKGMSCEHCAATVKKALEQCGLTDVYVDFSGGRATFENPQGQSVDVIADAVKKAGYELVNAAK